MGWIMFNMKLFSGFILLCLVAFLSACSDEYNYEIHFNTNGGSEISTIKIKTINDFVLPNHPTKNGYEFSGWYLDNHTFEIPFHGITEIEESTLPIILYAKWSVNITYSHLLHEGDYITHYSVTPHPLIMSVSAIFNEAHEMRYIVITSYSEFSFGKISLRMVVNRRGLIEEIEFIEYTSSYQYDDIHRYVKSYEGDIVSAFNSKPNLSTGATLSYDSIREHMDAMFEKYMFILTQLDITDDGWLGTNYHLFADNHFVATTHIVSRGIFKNTQNEIIGYLYQLRGSNIYHVDMDSTGTINLYIAIYIDGTIFGYDLPMDEYGHSKGFYYNRVINYLDQIIDKNISELIPMTDLSSGATQSVELIDYLLNQLKDHVN